MDKIILKPEDITDIFEWRDAHHSEVLSMPPTFKAIEICLEPCGDRMKVFRSGRKVKMHLAEGYKNLGNVELEISDNQDVRTVKGTPKIPDEDFQSFLALYFALMALIAYSRPDLADPVEKPPKKPSKQAEKPSKKPKKKQPVVISLKKTKSGLVAVSGNKRNSPNGVFSVRGHFRQYKSGKTVWVEQYDKGTGKKKAKKYKLDFEESPEKSDQKGT